jgi:hypothetical protein
MHRVGHSSDNTCLKSASRIRGVQRALRTAVRAAFKSSTRPDQPRKQHKWSFDLKWKVLPRIVTLGFANALQIPACDPCVKGKSGTNATEQLEIAAILGCFVMRLRSVRLTTFSGQIHIHFDNEAGFPYFEPVGEVRASIP